MLDAGDLVVTLLRAQFTNISLKFLSTSLSRLNGFQQPKALNTKMSQANVSCLPGKTHQQFNGVDDFSSQDAPNKDGSLLGTYNGHSDQFQLRKRVQGMLSDVLGVRVAEMLPGSAFEELSVDSLMLTEVLSEVRKRIEVAISLQSFKNFTHIQSSCHGLQHQCQSRNPSQTIP